MARIRVGDYREIFLTGTPESLNWGYDIATNDDKRYDVGVVRGKTKDNPYLPQEYYDSLRRAYSPEMVRAYLNGEFVNLNKGLVYDEFKREINIKKMDYKNLEICAGIDFNVDYMTAEIFAKGNGWIHYFDELRLKNSNSFDLADQLKKKYPNIVIYPDASGAARKSSSTKTDHQIFKDEGFRVKAEKKNPFVRDRGNAVNKLIRTGNLTIEPGTCSHLVKDFERLVWRSGDIDKVTDPTLSHASDAGGYPIAYEFPIRKREVYF